MNILTKIRSYLNVSTFFKIEITAIIIIIMSLGYFGIHYLRNNYNNTINIVDINNGEQVKANEVNRTLFKFMMIDEKSFSDVMSNKPNINSNLDSLDMYKNVFLSKCDSNIINSRLIDSLILEKKKLLYQYKKVNSEIIKVGNAIVIDTTTNVRITKHLLVFKKTKVIKELEYKVDPVKLNYEILKFNQSRNKRLNNILIKNTEINILLKEEAYKCLDKINSDVSNNRSQFVKDVKYNMINFIKWAFILLVLTGIFIRILIYDINKIFRKSERKDSFITSVLDRFKN